MATQNVHRSTQGEMLDEVVWRFYAVESGYIEKVLESPLNYRLADQPVVLPIGTMIVLPDISIPLKPIARLWD